MITRNSFLVSIFLLIIALLFFLYPRYKLYKFVKRWDNVADFAAFSYIVGSDFAAHFSSFYKYPTPNDSSFRASLCEHYGEIPEIYNYGMVMCDDTITLKDSVESVIKLYLKGPNHNEKNIGQTINSIDYKNHFISVVDISFIRFIVQKGDILISILPIINPCDNFHYRTRLAFTQKIDLDYADVEKSFTSVVFPLIRNRYGVSPTRIQDQYDNFAFICYEANLYPDTLILTQKCEPYDGKYDTTPMIELINNPLYFWAKEIGLKNFYFSFEVIPAFFEEKVVLN